MDRRALGQSRPVRPDLLRVPALERHEERTVAAMPAQVGRYVVGHDTEAVRGDDLAEQHERRIGLVARGMRLAVGDRHEFTAKDGLIEGQCLVGLGAEVEMRSDGQGHRNSWGVLGDEVTKLEAKDPAIGSPQCRNRGGIPLAAGLADIPRQEESVKRGVASLVQG